jgi:hypothetical protein
VNNRARKKHREIPYSPPQTELDENVRNVLTHLVKNLGTITFALGDLPVDGYVRWDVAQRQDGQKEITIWWQAPDEEQERQAG